MVISRNSGDLVLKFIDENNKVVFEEWFQLKKPAKKNYQEILVLLEEIRKHLKRQEDIPIEVSK